MERKFIFKSQLLGQLSHWSVRLSSYIPPYLPKLLEAAEKYMEENPFGTVLVDDMYEYSGDLYDYIRTMVHTVPEIATLNLRKEEIEAGLTAVNDVLPTDSSRRFRPADPKSSFVDLGALARNISNSIEREYEWDRESDKRIMNKINKNG